MIELRCHHKKIGEFDPESWRLALRCRHCSRRYKRDVYHEISIDRLTAAVANGQREGAIPTDDALEHWVA